MDQTSILEIYFIKVGNKCFKQIETSFTKIWNKLGIRLGTFGSILNFYFLQIMFRL